MPAMLATQPTEPDGLMLRDLPTPGFNCTARLVEPTKSQNITVIWRRSASGALGCAGSARCEEIRAIAWPGSRSDLSQAAVTFVVVSCRETSCAYRPPRSSSPP